MKHWFTDARLPSVGPPLAWGIAVVAIVSVFAVVAIIVNYGPLNNTTKERLVKMELPAARYDAVGALIKAAGQTCARVCRIEPASALSGATSLDVECAPQAQPTTCAAPIRYSIAVVPTN